MTRSDDTTRIVIGGQPLDPPRGLDVRNFLDDDVLAFEGRDRSGRTVVNLSDLANGGAVA